MSPERRVPGSEAWWEVPPAAESGREAVVAALYGKGQPKPLLDEAAAKMDKILKD